MVIREDSTIVWGMYIEFGMILTRLTLVFLYNRFEIDRISPDFEDDDEWIDEGESDLPSDYSILSLRIVA